MLGRVARINALEPQIAALSDEALRAKTDEFAAASRTARRWTRCSTRPSRWCARPPSARSASATSTCRWSAAWCCTTAASPRCAPAKARPWSPPCRSTSTRWRARASTSSPSTTTWPTATPNGWARSTGSSASRVGVIVHGLTQAERQRAYHSRHHLRHQQRVRLRLPARQPGLRGDRHGAAAAPLRHRRRGRLDPDRRGAHAADHLRARPRTARSSTAPSTRWCAS